MVGRVGATEKLSTPIDNIQIMHYFYLRNALTDCAILRHQNLYR